MYGESVNFVGVAGRAELGPINEFIDALGVDAFPHAVDDDGAIWVGYGVNTQPAFAFVNDDGTVETHIGPLGVEGLSSRLEALQAA